MPNKSVLLKSKKTKMNLLKSFVKYFISFLIYTNIKKNHKSANVNLLNEDLFYLGYLIVISKKDVSSNNKCKKFFKKEGSA